MIDLEYIVLHLSVVVTSCQEGFMLTLAPTRRLELIVAV